ncbi:MAG: ABC transporter ATP-binding protein, partial [Spirochaetaceae bacterium]|nr:ABC transporter ATP-binding protein [Spirochaetaceae bacterium]
PILILDEPTTGLDPNQIIEIRSLIRSLGKEKTVILSTHILQEVEAICSLVIILNEGRIAAQGAPSEIGEALKGEERIRLRIKTPSSSLDQTALLSLLDKLPGLRSRSIESVEGGIVLAEIAMTPRDTMATLSVEPGELVFDWAVANGLKLLELERRRLSLEEIFVKLTSEGEGK